MMACRAVEFSSSHSYCPSQIQSSLPLLCLSKFCLWPSHLSCSLSLYFMFRPPVLCTYLVPSVLLSLFVPACFTSPLSLHPLYSVFQLLPLALLLFSSFSSALSCTPCWQGHCAQQTTLRGLSAVALTCWEVGVQHLCTRFTRLTPHPHPLGSTAKSEGLWEQPEVKCSRRTSHAAMMQGDSFE